MKRSAASETLMWQIINLTLAIIFIVIPMLLLIRPIVQSNFSETKYYLKTYQIAIETLFSYEFLDHWILPKKGNEVVINPKEKELQIDKITTFLTIPRSDLPEINYRSMDKVIIKKEYLYRYISSVDFKVTDKFCIEFDVSVSHDIRNAIINNLSHVVGLFFDKDQCVGFSDVIINVTNNEIKCYYEQDFNCKELIYTALGSQEKHSLEISNDVKVMMNNITLLYTIMNSYKELVYAINAPLFFYGGEEIKVAFRSNKICENPEWQMKCGNSIIDEVNDFSFSKSYSCNNHLIISFKSSCYVSFKDLKLIKKEITAEVIIQNMTLEEEELRRIWELASQYESKELKINIEIPPEISKTVNYYENLNKNEFKEVIDANKFNTLIQRINDRDFTITLIDGVKVKRRFSCKGHCNAIANAIISNSRVYQINPLLFLALVIVESEGNPNAISESGCIGLGQVCPRYGRGEIAVKMYNSLRRPSSDVNVRDALKDIDVNVNLSMKILKDYYVPEVVYPANEKRKCECNIQGISYVVGPITYYGWQAALRKYNGLGCRCDYGHLFYVEIVLGIYDLLVQEYNKIR